MNMIQFLQENFSVVLLSLFTIGLGVKFLTYMTARTEFRYIGEINHRVHQYLNNRLENMDNFGFQSLVNEIIKRTNHELFVLRAQNMRRKGDRYKTVVDKIFFIPSAGKFLQSDLELKTAFFEKLDYERPDFNKVAINALDLNPVFGHLFSWVSINAINRVLSILPGTFIVLGIFGTFLGIVEGLPVLNRIDPTNVANSQLVLNGFISQMAFAMKSSLLGIALSLTFSFINSIFSYHAIRRETILRLSNALEFLWGDYFKRQHQEDKDAAPPALPEDSLETFEPIELKRVA